MGEQKEFDQILDLLEKLNELELKLISNAIDERLRFFWLKRNLKQLKKFSMGDRVKFKHKGVVVRGEIIGINQKSVSVRADDGVKWGVTPNFLRKIVK